MYDCLFCVGDSGAAPNYQRSSPLLYFCLCIIACVFWKIQLTKQLYYARSRLASNSTSSCVHIIHAFQHLQLNIMDLQFCSLFMIVVTKKFDITSCLLIRTFSFCYYSSMTLKMQLQQLKGYFYNQLHTQLSVATQLCTVEFLSI